MEKRMRYGKRKFSIDKFLSVVNIIALCLIGFTMIYPFWEILVKSFMTDKEIISSVNPDEFLSMGRSTPFAGDTVYGKNLMTIYGGTLVWQSK